MTVATRVEREIELYDPNGPPIRWLQGDCRDTLKLLPSKSVHMMMTSPPYFGLRSYGIPSTVWGGRPEDDIYHTGGCDHEIGGNCGKGCDPYGHKHDWSKAAATRRLYTVAASVHSASSALSASAVESQESRAGDAGNTCRCGAWLGTHGNEPTLEMFIANEVAIMRGVKRVLRDDGSVILNMGESWAGSGKGPTGHNGIGDQEERQGFDANYTKPDLQAGYKAKDMMMVPYRLAIALQMDGWYVRIDAPWFKGSAMPESVKDRISNSKEVVFHLAKSSRYYYDKTATRILNGNEASAEEYAAWTAPGATWQSGGIENYAHTNKENAGTHPDGRGRRNSDAAYESIDLLIEQCATYLQHLRDIRRDGGLMCDPTGDPLAMFVNPSPVAYEWCTGCDTLYIGDSLEKIERKYLRVEGGKMKAILICPGCGHQDRWMSHSASYPKKLVEPWVKACTSEKGVCNQCGNQWARVAVSKGDHLQWRPTCECPCWYCAGKGWVHETECRNMRCPECEPSLEGFAKPVPAIVLDIFGGTGTTAIVAEELGRRGVLCEIKDDYVKLSRALAEHFREARMLADRIERESRLGQGLLFGALS